MSKPEVSKKNKYWIERNRFYELKYFCLQYPIWKESSEQLDGLSKQLMTLGSVPGTKHSDPVAKCAEARHDLLRKMCIVEAAADYTDEEIGNYILTAVTNGYTYDQLNAKIVVPCGRTKYYELYRKFFYHLNDIRG